jgi:hypothetical protein
VAVKWLSIRLKNGEMKYSKKLAAEEMWQSFEENNLYWRNH